MMSNSNVAFGPPSVSRVYLTNISVSYINTEWGAVVYSYLVHYTVIPCGTGLWILMTQGCRSSFFWSGLDTGLSYKYTDRDVMNNSVLIQKMPRQYELCSTEAHNAINLCHFLMSVKACAFSKTITIFLLCLHLHINCHYFRYSDVCPDGQVVAR